MVAEYHLLAQLPFQLPSFASHLAFGFIIKILFFLYSSLRVGRAINFKYGGGEKHSSSIVKFFFVFLTTSTLFSPAITVMYIYDTRIIESFGTRLSVRYALQTERFVELSYYICKIKELKVSEI